MSNPLSLVTTSLLAAMLLSGCGRAVLTAPVTKLPAPSAAKAVIPGWMYISETQSDLSHYGGLLQVKGQIEGKNFVLKLAIRKMTRYDFQTVTLDGKVVPESGYKALADKLAKASTARGVNYDHVLTAINYLKHPVKDVTEL